jgi:tetratricopeptide (TPR) repeat protein
MSLSSDALTWYLAGIESHDAGELERAVEFLDAAVGADPDPTYRAALITALLDNGEFSRALPHCESLVARTPDDHVALIAIARCLAGMDRVPAAIDYQAKAVSLRPDLRDYASVLAQLRDRVRSERA